MSRSRITVSVPGGEGYDVAVIGGGPGGYVAAIRAAQAGLRTALVERDALGGICLNWGCIPSKVLLQCADVLNSIRHAADFGITVDGVHADYGAALARCQRVVAAQVSGLNYLMRKHRIDVVQGTGKYLARDRIAVTGGSGGDRELRTRASIIATGSRVRPLPGVAIDSKHVLSAREVWRETTLPRSILIVGAGAIGVEFATIYRAYGCDVTLVEYLPRVIPLEDEAVSAQLTKSLARRGIRIMTGTRVDRAEIIDGAVTVSLSTVSDPAAGANAAPSQIVRVDHVLVGAGFLPNSESLGLELLGVATERGYIVVDGAMETTVPGVYAIGDVTGKLPLAHVASAQAEVALEAILGRNPAPLDYAAMPRCIYGSPQVASMGQTETQARAGGRDIRVGSFPFRPNGKAMALGETEGWAKIISDAQTGELLGAHLIGPDVTELIAEIVVARMLESTPTELARAVHPHPTLSEVIAEAARNVEGQALHG
jgi:dihydrolipoamide dehydrogenase